MDPTHMLLLLYATEQKLGWHRDNGLIDGTSDQPVISLSLGNSCDFLLGEADDPISCRLESGDMVLFGGPSRHIKHAVSVIHANTTPNPLLELHRSICVESFKTCVHLLDNSFQACSDLFLLMFISFCRNGQVGPPSASFARRYLLPPPEPNVPPEGKAFRMNLTFRHAPELDGLENEDRFFHFAGPTRVFLEKQREEGTLAARAEAQLRKVSRKAKKQAKQEAKKKKELV
jgi:hypothetical protein